MDERFSRSARIFGVENLEKLRNSKVIVFGLGGVGGAVAESLARSGIGEIGLVDKDVVDVTNINRQLIATEVTVGMKKTDACEKRLAEIQQYVPGYQLRVPPLVDGNKVTVIIQVEGAGDFLPKYSGNLDIINSAAISVAEKIAEKMLDK